MSTKLIESINAKTHCKEIFFSFKRCASIFPFEVKNSSFCRCHSMNTVAISNRINTSKKSQTRLKFKVPGSLSTWSFVKFHGNYLGRNKEYEGKKLVGYSSTQMFDVVADVEKYQNFLPFCKKSFVKLKSPTYIKADLVIGFPPLVESYTSNVSLVRPQLIKAVCTEGKLFNYLLTLWKFSPGLKNNENTCIIDFFVSFEFKSALHSHLANLFFNELVSQMENAFYQEARRRYGEPVVKMQTLNIFKKNS